MVQLHIPTWYNYINPHGITNRLQKAVIRVFFYPTLGRPRMPIFRLVPMRPISGGGLPAPWSFFLGGMMLAVLVLLHCHCNSASVTLTGRQQFEMMTDVADFHSLFIHFSFGMAWHDAIIFMNNAIIISATFWKVLLFIWSLRHLTMLLNA